MITVLLGTFIWLEQKKQVNGDGTVQITFLGLMGDADCILISQGNSHVMIDTGEARDAEHIINFLKEKNITTLQSLILTHPDKDHIGGAASIMRTVKVLQVIQSPLQKNSDLQNQLNAAMDEMRLTSLVPTGVKKLRYGNVDFKIFAPEKLSYSKDNNYALITLVTYDKTNILLAGDAEKKRLEEAMQYNLPPIDIYKVAHHGRANGISAAFVEAIHPKIAVITSNEAEKEVLAALQNCGTQIYYTKDGDITFSINKKIIQLEKK